MRKFGDIDVALSMRDLITTLASAAVNKMRPKARYAKVTSIARATRKCTVRYTGDTGTVVVNMGNLQPSSIGQVVRIEGVTGDRFITDVMGPAYLDIHSGTVAGTATLPTSIVNRSYVDNMGGIKVSPDELGMYIDLNDWMTSGVYFQTMDVGAVSNFPEQRAGLLEVLSYTVGSRTHVLQRYTCARNGSLAQASFHRTYWNYQWSPWRKFTDTAA